MRVEDVDVSAVLLSLLLASALAVLLHRYRRTPPLPPGPRRWPVVGSAFSLSKEHEWLSYERWSQEHGASRTVSPAALF